MCIVGVTSIHADNSLIASSFSQTTFFQVYRLNLPVNWDRLRTISPIQAPVCFIPFAGKAQTGRRAGAQFQIAPDNGRLLPSQQIDMLKIHTDNNSINCSQPLPYRNRGKGWLVRKTAPGSVQPITRQLVKALAIVGKKVGGKAKCGR